jgi:hypothetical protein
MSANARLFLHVYWEVDSTDPAIRAQVRFVTETLKTIVILRIDDTWGKLWGKPVDEPLKTVLASKNALPIAQTAVWFDRKETI